MALLVYKLNSAAANTFKTVTIDSLTQFSIEQQGDETTLSADGFTNIQRAYIDNLSYIVTLQGMNTAKDVKVGECGALVLNAVERVDCATGGTADTITFTFSNALCTGVTKTVNHTAQSETSYTFRCFKPDGTDPLTIS
jgi:hypothetical protein